MSANTSFAWATLGGVVIGVVTAASLLIVEHFKQERRRQAMAHDLVSLNNQVRGLQSQLETLQLQKRSEQERRRKLNPKPKASIVKNSMAEDYLSALDSSSDMDEFYDLSEDEETSKASTITPIDSILKGVDEQIEVPEQLENVLETLLSLRNEYPDNTEVLWRIGKTYHRMSNGEGDVQKKMALFNLGIDACRKALTVDRSSADGHKWCAILLGSRSSHQNLKDKLRDSKDFKTHIDIAIELKPEDSTCLYLLGRYIYEIASLRWYERKAAEAIFDKLPPCSFDEALEKLLQADRIGPSDWKLNKLSIAKCYVAKGDYKEAVKWLEEASGLSRAPSDDASVDEEVSDLLRKYNGYR